MSLKTLLQQTPYLNYLYAYPHKTAYRPFNPPYSLKQLWQEENKKALFLYLHLPFCEMRCGFCNLFTTANPKASLVNDYLTQLTQQADQINQALGDYSFSNIAIGGGTPTYLNAGELTRLFKIITEQLGVELKKIPIGIETSPDTVSEDRLQVLKDHHVNRISIGIESFSIKEAHAMGRPQKEKSVQKALNLIQQAQFDTLNIDLIYGAMGQTVNAWLDSVQQAIAWQAHEIYLYPLYVRPLTGLGRKGQQQWDDQRLACYYAAQDLLIKKGYQQISMRLFRQKTVIIKTSVEYHCQEDGMIGLGCGARSYTKTHHYSSDYAVNRQSIIEIIKNYNQLSIEALNQVNYGIQLNQDEQRRRYVLLSLLQCEGLSRLAYQQQFGQDVLIHFPQLNELISENLAVLNPEFLQLNNKGIAYSDVIGTWLFSPEIRQKMADYQWH